MLHVLASLSPLRVLVMSAVGFLLGAVWHPPLLFAKAWMSEAKLTPEMWTAKSGPGPKPRGAPCSI